MKIYNLYFREYWQETTEDTSLGSFSSVENAVAKVRQIASHTLKTAQNPYYSYLICMDVLDDVTNLGDIVMVLDRSATPVFIPGTDKDRLVPHGYHSRNFPSIAS